MKSSSLATVFGKPIEELSISTIGVPSFIPTVRDYLVRFARSEGIFRKNGFSPVVDDLGVIFSCPQCAIPPSASVYDVSTFLTRWLNSLPEPLVPAGLAQQTLVQDSPASVVDLLKAMPELNRKTLSYVFQIMEAVISYSAVNKMSYANMMTCFVAFLIQNQRGNNRGYQFSLLYAVAVKLINKERNDFVLDGPLVQEVINQPYVKPLLTPSTIPHNQSSSKFVLKPATMGANRRFYSTNTVYNANHDIGNSPAADGTH